MALNNFESEYQLTIGQLDNWRDYYEKCYVCLREWLYKEDYLKSISD